MTGAAPSDSPGRARRVFRHVFAPAVIAFSVATWVWRAPLSQRVNDAVHMDYASTTFLLLALAVSIAEAVFPARREWSYRLFSDARGVARLGRDLVYLFFVTQVSALIVAAASTRLTSLVAAHGPRALARLWPVSAPFWLKVTLAFFAVELCSYWIHRASHHVEPLWRFHSTHHAAGELSALVAARMHPVDSLVEAVVRVAPLALVGAGAPELVAVAWFSASLSLLSHANVDVSERGLGWLVNLPSFHAVHHSASVDESRSNFGCHTVLWDRVFGTFRREAKAPLALGVLPLGRRTLWQELAWPFYRRVS